MSPLLEIFSQGEEVVCGQIVDSNAAWLSQQAIQQGFTVTRHTAVGDKLHDLIDLLREIAHRADCCICTGGLGPTSDDLTAEAVAAAFAIPLEFDAIAYQQMAQFFQDRKKTMPAINRKQALLPQGSVRLDNHWGTAPGFALKQQRCWFVFLPGVPHEMQQIFQHSVLPLLPPHFHLRPKTLITIKTLGIGESELQQRLQNLTLPPDIELGFKADATGVQVKLLFPPDYPLTSRNHLIQSVTAPFPDFIFAIDSPEQPAGDLISIIDQLMQSQNRSLILVESISHGLMSALCPGASWLLASSYQPCAEIKPAVDDTPATETLTAKAIALALKQQETNPQSLVLTQTNSQTNTTVTVLTLLLDGNRQHQIRHDLSGSHKRTQQQAAYLGWDFLRRYLQDRANDKVI